MDSLNLTERGCLLEFRPFTRILHKFKNLKSTRSGVFVTIAKNHKGIVFEQVTPTQLNFE